MKTLLLHTEEMTGEKMRMLLKNGIITVKVQDVNNYKLLTPVPEAHLEAITNAALMTLAKSGTPTSTKAEFIDNLVPMLVKKEKKTT